MLRGVQHRCRALVWSNFHHQPRRRSSVSTERPYYPALLKVPAADELYDSGDFSLAAICEHIAYDRVCVSAKYSDNRFFMYNDQSGASHLLKDETENADHFINLTTDEL